MKKLYEFEVDHTVVTKVEEKTDDGVLIKDVETTGKKKVYIKLPGRREIEQMRVIQAAEFGKAVGMGVQTKESMRTSILDNGGFSYAKVDLEAMDQLLPRIEEARNKYFEATLAKQDASIHEKEFNELSKVVQQMEARLLEVFEHSAETLAERNTTVWAVIHLTLWDDDSPMFPGQAEETKMDFYYRIFDEPEKYASELNAFTIANYALTAYLYKGYDQAQIEETLKSLEA